MSSHIYTDKGSPAVSLHEEVLTDGSKAFNLMIGEKEVCCTSEKAATEAFVAIAFALRVATSQDILIL